MWHDQIQQSRPLRTYAYLLYHVLILVQQYIFIMCIKTIQRTYKCKKITMYNKQTSALHISELQPVIMTVIRRCYSIDTSLH